MSCKAVILLSRRDDMSHEEFLRWWIDEHAPLAAQLPGVRRIVFNACTEHEDVDGISELWFDSRADFDAAYATELGRSVAADSMAHVRSRTRLFVDEHAVVTHHAAAEAHPFAIDRAAQDLLFREARTARSFTDDPVTDDQVAALYDLVRWAPTLMNTQPLRLVVVRSDDARERLMHHLAEGNRPKTATAPLAVVLAADTAFHDTLPEVFPHNPDARNRFLDDERRTRTALEQAWLQAGYFIVGVRALGLAAGPMAGFDAAGLDADLLAGTPLRSFLVVNIGHPAGDAWHARLPRLGHDDAVITL